MRDYIRHYLECWWAKQKSLFLHNKEHFIFLKHLLAVKKVSPSPHEDQDNKGYFCTTFTARTQEDLPGKYIAIATK